MAAAPAGDGGAALAAAFLGVVAGTALQLQQAQLWPVWAHAALLGPGLAGCAWLLWRRPRSGPWRALAWALAVAAAAAGGTGLRAHAYQSTALDPALEGEDLLLRGTIAALPHRLEGGLRFRFAIESAQHAGRAVTLPPAVLLGWYGAMPGDATDADAEPVPPLRPGERWELPVRLKAPHGLANPHGFDYELWLWEQGLQATGHVRVAARGPSPRRLGAGWRHPLEQVRQRVRERILLAVPDARWAGVLAALVVGDQGAITRADWEVFRATGIAHLMSISGLHVTMFGWAAALAITAGWRRSARLCLAWPAQHAALVGGVLLALAYAAFSGWGVPAQRTVLMMATVAGLRLAACDWPWPWVWLLACAVVLLRDPWALLQPGFWLSFVAVGVLFASGRRHRVEEGDAAWSARPGETAGGGARAPASASTSVAAQAGAGASSAPAAHAGHAACAATRSCALASRLWRPAGALLREQWIVTLALTPLSLLLFGQVSLVGLVANLLAIPLVTLGITPLGLAGIFVPALWPLAAAGVAGLAAGAQWLAAWPHATWSAPAAPLWAGVAGVCGGVLLVLRLPLALRMLGLPLLLPVLLWQPQRPAPGHFDLLAADVGQGNAVLLRTARHSMLYDAGPDYSRGSDAGERVLVPLLRAGGERLDLLVLSHRDSDHTGGAAAVLAMQPQAALLSSLEATHPLHQLRAGTACHAGQAWTWDGVHFSVLHPPTQEAAARPNARSCVLRVESADGTRALLAGDIERGQEMRLLQDPQALRADWLLVPHHGSNTSSSAPFLAAVDARWAVVQAGYRNRFGHPAPAVLARHRAQGTAVVPSTHCGAAHWATEAPHTVRCQRDEARRYWHHPLPGLASALR